MANPTLHPDIEVISGDGWAIAGNLTDLDGSPLDLTTATLEWVLADFNGAVVASFPGNVSVAIWPAPGSLTIIVDRDVTALFEAGGYTDKLRVTVAGLRDLMWTGRITVGAPARWRHGRHSRRASCRRAMVRGAAHRHQRREVAGTVEAR
jgi:hypothetical protein